MDRAAVARRWAECHAALPLRLAAWPQACRFKVPANQVLVEPDDDGASTPQLGPARACAIQIGSSAVPGLISIPSGIAICSDTSQEKTRHSRDKVTLR